MAASTTTAAQIFSIATSLMAAGSLTTTSLIEIPQLQSQPASRALPQLRWYFSRGSHIFPQAAGLSAAGFIYLAINALPPNQLSNILKYALQGGKVSGYLAAAALSFGIAPVTMLLMIPTNFAIIKMNEELGGARSEKSAKQGGAKPKDRKAEEALDGEDQANQFTDLSGPQSKSTKDSSPEQDKKAKELLGKFAQLNGLRAALMLAGGMVGLWTALA
ncbi:hypothetical protein LTR86_009580 [Recurvomyces mirabilis]|nr:hypothetical protein LTR86_009580 [Recurvomyces mirabilis]